MKNKKTILCVIPAVIFIINNFVCAYNQIIDLGQGCAYSVNDNGMIVGQSGGQACLFDSTGGGANINLGSPGGSYSYGKARSVNNSGQIVGYVGNDSSFINGSTNACIFDKTGGGNNINLGMGSALANNNNGQIVGWSNSHVCIFDSTGGGANISLGPYGPGYWGSIVRSINNSGQMVGDVIDGGDISYYDAVLFDSTGGGNDIGLALGFSNSHAYSINNNGQIVGYFNNDQACLFDSTGGGNNIDLGDGIARSINDSGQIVGDIGGIDAYLFDSTGQGNNIFLNTLIDPSSGWNLQYAYEINNNGWIVGQGTYNGQTRAFLLVVPEPATLLLFGLGALILKRKI
jgi:hypothetical protein